MPVRASTVAAPPSKSICRIEYRSIRVKILDETSDDTYALYDSSSKKLTEVTMMFAQNAKKRKVR